MSADQWHKPLKYKNVDGLAFAENDPYPEIVVRRRDRRWFGVDIGGAKINAWAEDDTLFDVEIKDQPYCAHEVNITGKKSGGCWLGFYRDGDWENDLGWVYVRVYPLKAFKVNVYMVRDATGLWPRTSLASALEMLDQINREILKPMAGMELKPHITDGFSIAPNASTMPIASGDYSADDEVWTACKDKARQYDASSQHLNLYFLRRYRNRDICVDGVCEKNVVGTGLLGARHCIVEDAADVWTFTTIIAHELMHSLGMSHNAGRGSGALMYSTAKGGYWIYPEDVVEVRGEPE